MNEWCTLVAHIHILYVFFCCFFSDARLFSFKWYTMVNWNSAPHKNSLLNFLWHFTFFYCYYNAFLIWIPFFSWINEENSHLYPLLFILSVLTKDEKIFIILYVFFFGKREGDVELQVLLKIKYFKNYFSSESATKRSQQVWSGSDFGME